MNAGNALNRAVCVMLACAGSGAATVGGAETTVLTSLQATYSVAAALTEGTDIKVENLPAGGRRMNSLASFFESQGERLAETIESADAVITIGRLWGEDPTYTAARAFNIRIVNIDATRPWSATLPGVSVAQTPVSAPPWQTTTIESESGPSIFFWLSPANGIRMADIIAADLMRLVPAEAGRIRDNLAAFQRELLDLKREYELRFLQAPSVTVFALASEFVYLTVEFGLHVDGYFVQQDLYWDESDLAALREHLSLRRIPVVLHKWQPAEAIQAAIRAGGAELVVLETGEAPVPEDGRLPADGYQELLRRNLEALAAALAR